MKYLFIPAIALLLASCERQSTPIGGKGGKATLRVSMGHDEELSKDGTIYIKYNSDDMPANKAFDDSAVIKTGEGKPAAVFSELKAGKYFLFGKGYDPNHADEIKGGAKYTITKETVLEYTLSTGH
jgi:hypothetical protein